LDIDSQFVSMSYDRFALIKKVNHCLLMFLPVIATIDAAGKPLVVPVEPVKQAWTQTI